MLPITFCVNMYRNFSWCSICHHCRNSSWITHRFCYALYIVQMQEKVRLDAKKQPQYKICPQWFVNYCQGFPGDLKATIHLICVSLPLCLPSWQDPRMLPLQLTSQTYCYAILCKIVNLHHPRSLGGSAMVSIQHNRRPLPIEWQMRCMVAFRAIPLDGTPTIKIVGRGLRIRIKKTS